MNHSLMYFASRYLRGKESGVLPEGMDDSWFEALTELVLNDQDPESGYWGTDHNPVSMGITFHFIDGLFAYYSIQREDTPDITNPRRHLAVREIPNANRIVETTLAMQAVTNEKDSLAAWPRIAYNYTSDPNQGQERASLVVSNNAIALLRSCERFVDDKTRERIYESIRSSMKYILTHCVLDDGLWLQSDTHPAPSTSFYMHRILSQSHYLERKLRPNIPPPLLDVTITESGELLCQWHQPLDNDNSVRIYAAPAEVGSNKLDESHIIAIIHVSGEKMETRDPLVVASDMRQAMLKRWGSDWPRNSYQGRKSRIVNEQTLIINNQRTLSIPIDKNKNYYASAVTWYGEESLPEQIH